VTLLETKTVIIELRKRHNLSQDEMAERLFVTRQAVSRWETGETVPNTETLKLISKEFGVSTDVLLGSPPMQCQSCGMSLYSDDVKGSERDGTKSEEYCAYCYGNGVFLRPMTLEEAIEHNIKFLDSWNEENELTLTPDEARKQLREFLPTLKRWKVQ
jgi:transcriptional regulator with XRE-family HTH domain